MNLLQVRMRFIQLSGRNDLVVNTTSYADNGADFYINAGQRFLDRKYRFPKDTGIYPKVLAIGSWSVVFPYCRAIKEVWAADDESRWQLEKKSWQDFLAEYNEPFELLETGTTLYYTPALLRSIPESDRATSLTTSAVVGYMPTMVGAHYAYNGILIGPPTDVQLHLEVHGLFYSPELSADTDLSYWSVVHPETLVRAALYELEIDYRNTQGANDWLGALETHTAGIDQDVVEEEISESDQMEG